MDYERTLQAMGKHVIMRQFKFSLKTITNWTSVCVCCICLFTTVSAADTCSDTQHFDIVTDRCESCVGDVCSRPGGRPNDPNRCIQKCPVVAACFDLLCKGNNSCWDKVVRRCGPCSGLNTRTKQNWKKWKCAGVLPDTVDTTTDVVNDRGKTTTTGITPPGNSTPEDTQRNSNDIVVPLVIVSILLLGISTFVGVACCNWKRVRAIHKLLTTTLTTHRQETSRPCSEELVVGSSESSTPSDGSLASVYVTQEQPLITHPMDSQSPRPSSLLVGHQSDDASPNRLYPDLNGSTRSRDPEETSVLSL